MNPNRPVKYVHITLQGHDMYVVPPYDVLGYCMEGPDEGSSVDHTHIVVALQEKMTKNEIIEYVAFNNDLNIDRVRVDPHQNLSAMVGYHTGKGEKPCCLNWTPITAMPKSSKAIKNKRLCTESPKELIADGTVSLLQLDKLIKNQGLWNLINTEQIISPVTKGVWIWGETGTGKSNACWTKYPKLFKKPQSKWWDSYDGQKIVLIDDMDTDVLAHYLKIWADHYPCSGETKGGTIPLQHEKIIVTSNFSIKTLFEKMPLVTVDALERRFIQIYKDKNNNILDLI